ncbi:MAG TPA: folylpolyglutamate synthase/dihydrofolate synthase family protein [Gemmatimonadaceae bacterium]|nr:folylpolyglutamate synthase/dihydrofolate synthase family protein [Gemmatimonadaceae bacterium]
MDRVLTSYRDAIAALFARTTGAWKLGLERTTALLDQLGNPHRAFPSFHVAGTNGKGSVVATLAALLESEGLRVGRYTSPHLVDFRERIVVDGQQIGEREVLDWLLRWMPAAEALHATFFEVTTCLAFSHFARTGVDVAVVEVGLGGRLDATNVITPLVSAVTSIGLEHTEYLGATIELVAREKAGVFKPGVPAVIGEADPEVAALLARCAAEAGASRTVVVGRDVGVADVTVEPQATSFSYAGADGAVALRTGLVGSYQARNSAVALAMLDVAGGRYAHAARRASGILPHVTLPGRFERVGTLVFDVAHNAPGMTSLVQTLRAVQPERPLVVLLGVLGDKDWRAIIAALSGEADRMVLCAPPSAPAARAWTLADALAAAREMGVDAVAEPDFDRALARAREGAGTTLVTGSFHTVGDAMARLQGVPPGS